MRNIKCSPADAKEEEDDLGRTIQLQAEEIRALKIRILKFEDAEGRECHDPAIVRTDR